MPDVFCDFCVTFASSASLTPYSVFCSSTRFNIRAMEDDPDRTASLMTPAKLAQMKARPKAAAGPAAWLDQLAADAGSGHVRRLVDLRRQLEAQVREHGYAGVQAALDTLGEALQQLDFDLLQPKGLLARVTGKGKEERAGFVAQFERIGRAGEDLEDELRELQRKLQGQNTAAARTLAEFDVEVKAIEKIIDQGARWLQDMRNQLKAREAAAPDAVAQKQMDDDAARCEVLVSRLKQLRGASSAAQQAAERCRAAGDRRTAFLQASQQALDQQWAGWQGALAPLAAAEGGTGVASRGIGGARGATDELQSALRQAAQDCTELQAQEQALAGELAALHEPLQAAA